MTGLREAANVSVAIRDLRQFGLTVGDIARMFRVHPKAVESILDSPGPAQRRDLRKEVSGVALALIAPLRRGFLCAPSVPRTALGTWDREGVECLLTPQADIRATRV